MKVKTDTYYYISFLMKRCILLYLVINKDILLPAEIVGKQTRYRVDGSKNEKVFLEPKEWNNTEYKLESFAAVCRKLCGKDVAFEFPVTEA